jgi:hypothetical protein
VIGRYESMSHTSPCIYTYLTHMVKFYICSHIFGESKRKVIKEYNIIKFYILLEHNSNLKESMQK